MSLSNNVHCTHQILRSLRLHLHRTADFFRGLPQSALRGYPLSLNKFSGIGQFQCFENLMDREPTQTDTARTDKTVRAWALPSSINARTTNNREHFLPHSESSSAEPWVRFGGACPFWTLILEQSLPLISLLYYFHSLSRHCYFQLQHHPDPC